MIDTSINVATLVTLMVIGVGFVAWLIRMEARVNTGKDSVTELRVSVGALSALVSLHKEQFHEYQLQASREYMTQTTVAEIKRDIVAEIARMEGRVEAQIDRLVRQRDETP